MKRITTSIVIAAAVLVIAAVIIALNQPKNTANSYQQCVDAGGAILETYPEQCKIGDKMFTNDAQMPETSNKEYVGLTEQAALDAAQQAGKAARVVQRDNEDLPVTMDFSPGRLNLYVQEGKVYMVQVEGEN